MAYNRFPLKSIVPMILFLFLPLVFLAGISSAVAGTQPTIAGLSAEEAMKMGERMYRDGILPSGEPMQALVQGDIPVDSRMFSCVSCHLRSGMGSIEGRVVTYPIDGITLYEPLTLAWNMRWISGSKRAKALKGDLRSAYNDETLAASIRGGVNPDGKALNYTMPRYSLGDKDMEVMIYYLKNLSVKPSAGFSDETIRFAVVVTEGVRHEDIEAMMAPLNQMAGSSRGGKLSKMARLSLAADPADLMNRGYIKVSVDRWDLKGPDSSWRSQLDAYYKTGPVFAVVGGMSNGDWTPVHEFCEEERIPCILPIVDLPAVSETDWYTVYLSKGLYQEGEAAAKYLKGKEDLAHAPVIIEVYRDSEQGRAMAKGFDESWGVSGERKIDRRMLPRDEAVTEEFWKQLSVSSKNAVILVWLDSKDISSISALADMPDKPRMIFLSSTISGEGMYTLPERIRKISYITYPYRLPEDFARYQPLPPASTTRYLTLADYHTIRGKANIDVMLITKAIFMLKGYFNRDRFLEVIDMMKDEQMIPLYPRLSFGPGQRYISKGCYIVQVGEGAEPKVSGVSDWVIPER